VKDDEHYHDLYLRYLHYAGYSEAQYEAALLAHIDRNWNDGLS
jgi:hypothetical protein